MRSGSSERQARRQLAGYRKKLHQQAEVIRAQRWGVTWADVKLKEARKAIDEALIIGATGGKQ